ncbi:hypothetical protein HZB03_04940 [Candidatus Woesearchaeota archaeon]|nr:hypothetical protein [Candidatus Woesearchaeota archaeon]
MKGIYQAVQRGFKVLALAGGTVALSGCDTPEVKTLHQTQAAATGCSIKLELIVKKASIDFCRLEVTCADGKTSLLMYDVCRNFEGLRIKSSNGRSYTLEVPTFGDPYLMGSKPEN